MAFLTPVPNDLSDAPDLHIMDVGGVDFVEQAEDLPGKLEGRVRPGVSQAGPGLGLRVSSFRIPTVLIFL